MSTWGTLIDNTQLLVDDTSGDIVSEDFILDHLEYGELFTSLTKGEYEKTGDLTLSASTPLYTIHSTLTDYVRALRITISNNVIKRSTLSTIALMDPAFYTSTGTPEFFYPVGGTLLGFYPVPTGTLTAKVTYLAVPPKDISDTTLSPYIQTLNQTLLPHYAAAIAFGREGDVERGIEQLKIFVESLGKPLSKKFINMLRQARRPKPEEKPIREISE